MKYNFDFIKTPLHLAIEKGNYDIFKLLLAKSNIDANIELISLNYYIKFKKYM